MMQFLKESLLPLLLLSVILGGCGDDSPADPAAAQQIYGSPVDPTDAIPAPALAAEARRYVGDRVTVDGRIASVTRDGCTLHLATDGGPPLRVDAPRTEEASCAWRVPGGTKGFTVTSGTLRTDRDTLRLLANGVQITPLHSAE